jgi:hypothetical protein
MHWRQRWQRWNIQGGGGTSKAEVEAAEVEAAEAEMAETEVVEVEAADASEVAACIGSIGMHRKRTEADGADGADGAGGEYKVSEAVKTVRTC